MVPSLPQTQPRFQLISNAGRHPSGNLPCSSRQSSQLFLSCLLRAPNKYVPWRGQGDSRRTGTETTSSLFFLLKRASLSNLLGKIQSVRAKLVQSYPTLCDPMDLSPPGSSVHGFSRQEYWSQLLALLQGIFLTQGSNLSFLHILHWQVGSLLLAPPGKPYISISTLN